MRILHPRRAQTYSCNLRSGDCNTTIIAGERKCFITTWIWVHLLDKRLTKYVTLLRKWRMPNVVLRNCIFVLFYASLIHFVGESYKLMGKNIGSHLDIPCFRVYSFFFLDYSSLDHQFEESDCWHSVSLEQFEICDVTQNGRQNTLFYQN